MMKQKIRKRQMKKYESKMDNEKHTERANAIASAIRDRMDGKIKAFNGEAEIEARKRQKVLKVRSTGGAA